nr:basic proline-rich protein-like [Equus asinus]
MHGPTGGGSSPCPGPAAAPLGPPRCAEEDAPPPRPPPPAALREERGSEAQRLRPAPARAPAGSPGSRRRRPRQVARSSRARPGPTPRQRPPPLLARQRAGLRGKESERETAPAAAWPVPAPRPPSPCRRERAGSAGPLGSGPIGRGGPRAQGRCRLQGQLHPLPTAGAAAGHAPGHARRPRASQVPPTPRPPRRRSSRATRSSGQILSRVFSPPASLGCFHHNNVWYIFPGGCKNNESRPKQRCQFHILYTSQENSQAKHLRKFWYQMMSKATFPDTSKLLRSLLDTRIPHTYIITHSLKSHITPSWIIWFTCLNLLLACKPSGSIA